MKKLFQLFLIFILLLLFLPALCWGIVELYGRQYITQDEKILSTYATALVLGTSPYIGTRNNIFYTGRMNAMHDLYLWHDIEMIVVSGDWVNKNYNEPLYMLDSLVWLRIPEEIITQDPQGIATLESVLWARDVYGYNAYIIVSQPFHLKRALFIARMNGINAIGYPAQSIPFRIAPRVYIREIGARMKAVWEYYFLK